jgi:microcystin-dependent protein
MFNLPIPPMPFPGMGLTTPVALPVGTVVVFAGKIASSSSESPSDYTTNIEALGWMVCDGRACEVSKYPELFAVLGYLYGGEDGKFKVPDYQGLFLRGVNDKANNDPDVSSRKPPSPNGTNEGVGSMQEDALQEHQHEYVLLSATTGGTENKAAMLVDGATNTTSKLTQGRISKKETRPKNVYVYYIIKYTNG